MGLMDRVRGGRIKEVEGARRSDAVAADVMIENLKESLSTLEQTVGDDREWRRIAFNVKREFTRPGLDDVAELSRAMYLSSPLIQRAVNVTTYYVHGQGITVKANDERIQKEVIEPQMEDDGNRAELYAHQSRLLTEVDQMLDGNVFLSLVTNPLGEVAIRSIPVEDIREVHHKPGDKQQIWYYRRLWTEEQFNNRSGRTLMKQREALYPDWRYLPAAKPNSIGGIEVMWDSPIIHRKTGGLKHMMFGFPETYAALDWARAYRKFLEDWHTLVSSLARFAWKVSTKGSKVKGTKKKIDSTIQDTGEETNPAGVAGGVAITSGDDSITPIPKTGAHTSADDARPSRLMVAGAMDLPDTILSGDVDVGNFATSKTLDRPTELAMRNRQIAVSELEQDIFRYSIDSRVRRGRLPGRTDFDVNGMLIVEPSMDATVTVSFPPILEHDVATTVKAIVAAATLEGKSESGNVPRETVSKLLMEAIGVEDIEGALSEIGPEEREALEQATKALEEARKVLR